MQRRGTVGEVGGDLAEVMDRSRRSHKAPTLVPREAETASAGMRVPRIEFISGSGQGAMSVMLQTTMAGTPDPASATAVLRHRVA